MKSLRSIIVISIFLAVSLIAFAGEKHIFHLNHEQGLSSNYVRGIGQDSRGFIWVATIDGLNRFDGQNFISYKKENSGLPGNELNAVLQDPSNPDRIWISTRHDGICSFDYNTGIITPLGKGLSSNDIPALTPSSDGKIWVANFHYAPDKLDPVALTVEKLFDSMPEGFPRNIWCLKEDPSGRYLYIGHELFGLTRVDLKSKKFRNYTNNPADPASIAGKSVYSLHIDNDGCVWLGTDAGISLFNPQTEKFINVSSDLSPQSLMPGTVKTICHTSDGNLWFGTTEGGISILTADNVKKRTFSFFNPTDNRTSGLSRPVSSTYVQSIFEDSFGNIWMGNFSDGLDVMAYQPPFFIQEQPFPSSLWELKRQAVWSSAADMNGNIWIGGEDEIRRIGSGSDTIVKLPASKDKRGKTHVLALMFDRSGKLWIGTSNSGVFIYDTESGNLTHLEWKGDEKEIRAFVEEADGAVLIGTYNGIFRSQDGKSAVAVNEINNKLSDLYVLSMALDRQGSLWVGTFRKGFNIISPDGTSEFIRKTPDGFPSWTVNAIMEDREGYMWLATREGLARIAVANHSDIRVFNTSNGLLNNDVKAIEEDNDGKLWFSSGYGIGFYDPITDKISVYHRTYAARMVSFTEGSSCRDGENRIYFGSLNGLTHFNASQKNRDPNDSKVILSGILAHDSNASDQNLTISIPVNSKDVTLPYNLNTFTIRFSDPDITCATNSIYSYNMKGVNEVWSMVNERNEAVYRNLKPGKYTFRVCQRLNGGEWSKPIVIANITITPPLYLTWWAISLYVVAALAIIAIFLYFFKHKIDLEKNLEIEKQNSKNIAMLNEERLKFFTNITHELRTPLSLIVGPIEDLINDTDIKDDNRRKLHTIRTSSMRLLNLINGILEFRKTETANRKLEVVEGNLANFIREIGLRFKELNNNRNVSITIDVADLEGTLMFYDPEMISTILNNLLGNALKYTKEGTISLTLKLNEINGVRYADIIVADTGEGISEETLPHIFKRYYQAHHNRKVSGTGIGLALTKNLVDLHEGTISAQSQLGKGSVFTVRLLVDNCYPNALHRNLDSISYPELTDAGAAPEDAPLAEDKLKILVVEDDDDVRQYISHAFSDQFNVITASDGKEGFELVRENFPDIVVSDIMMPVMDGIELCRAIKSDLNVSHIPVILLTAKDSMLDREEGYKSGADSYITKPFSANLLRSRISNILESRHKLSLHMLELSTSASDSAGKTQDPTEISETTEVQEPASAELTPLDKKFIMKFRELVEENLEMEEMDIQFFTDKMCMSHSTLYRKVKAITGFTPNEFVRKIKLRKATEMLRSGNFTINDISFRTGFNSPAYFRRVFKKEFGVSPSEFVNGNSTEQTEPD